MTDKEIQLLAESGANVLSTFRLFLPDLKNIYSKQKQLFSWPPEFQLEKLREKQRLILAEKGIISSKKSASYFQISYNSYNSLKNKGEEIDASIFKKLRETFAFERLTALWNATKNSDKLIKIYIAHREPIAPENRPKNTADEEKIRSLANIGDILWNFTYDDFKVKIPSFFAPVLFYDLKVFNQYPIQALKARNGISGKFVNKKQVKTRNIVLDRDKESFLEILKASSSNLIKLVEDKQLYSLLESKHEEYNVFKKKNSWKSSLG